MKLSESLTAKLKSVAHLVENKNFNDLEVSEASLSGLKKLLSPEEIKSNKNFEYYAGDLAVGAIVNKNDDGVTIEDAVRVYKMFEGTPIDIEHETSKVVGYIVKCNLTDPETKEILTDEQALSYSKPINISIAFLIWPRVDKGVANILEEVGDEENPAAGLISLSWEMAFDEYKLLVGSRNVFEGKVIDDDSEIEKIEGALKCNGGTGLVNGSVPVYRLITGGNLLPLGAGLVVKPAAQVNGIIKINDNNNSVNINDESESSLNNNQKSILENKNHDKTSSLDNSNDNHDNLVVDEISESTIASVNEELEKSSLSKNDTVKQLRMKIKNISDINDETLKTVEASEVTRFIASELENKAAEHQKTVEAKEKEAADAKAAAAEAIAKTNETNEKLEAVTKELDTIKAARLAEKAESDFNVRMAALDEEFELSDADRKVIASQIKDLAEDTFASWKESFDVIASAKSKEALKKAADEKAKEAKEDPKEEKGESDDEEKAEGSKKSDDKKAKADDDMSEGKKAKASENEDPLKEVVASKAVLPSSIAFGEDAIAKFRDAFKIGTSVTITK